MEKNAFEERLKSTGRNEPCPCGSGKKYKQCHLSEDSAARHAMLKKAEEERQAALAAAEAEEDEDKDGKAKSAPVNRNAGRMVGKERTAKDRHTNVPRRGAV